MTCEQKLPEKMAATGYRGTCPTLGPIFTLEIGVAASLPRLVKPAKLHFARAARALTGRYMCERGVLSEYPVARARASYWFESAGCAARSARGGHARQRGTGPNLPCVAAHFQILI